MNVPTVAELEVPLPDGRRLHVYDTHPGAQDRLSVVWHHGTPNIGSPPQPLFEASERLGIRWISYDRPGYGGSSPNPGRSVASAAFDVTAVADAVGVLTFAVMGHSGGSAHALACAALMPKRVVGTVGVATPAPFDADGLDWFAGMSPVVEASLRAATAGRRAKEAHEASAGDDDPGFTSADWEALRDDWAWFGSVVGPALRHGPDPLIDDDLAYVAPWGFDPAVIGSPVVLMHGTADQVIPSAHSEWLARRIPSAELWLKPDESHISVLTSAEAALEWLAALPRD